MNLETDTHNMSYAICHVPVVPLRSQPTDSSEMVSHILFGECFEILERNGNWVKVKLSNDGYEGWIDYKSMLEIDKAIHTAYLKSKPILTSELFAKISHSKGDFYVPMGSKLPLFHDKTFKIGEELYSYDGVTSPRKFDETTLIQVALSFLKAPYLWGGKTIFGIDCSGFTQIVMAQFGVSLFRDAYQQATQGILVSFVLEAQTGDLAFFENADGKIIHVGLILPDSQIVHAHGEVRIDSLDDMGIFNKKTGKHSHRLRFIKRFF